MGVKNSANGVIVRHKEYIADIGPSILFEVEQLPIQPGSDITFPWLSQIAMAFQEYKWRGLVFTYKTTSSDLVTSTNPSLGTVIMSTDYNAAEEPFSDKRTMENYEFTSSSKPSLSFEHMVETSHNQTAHPTLYTRDGPPPPNADIRLYDIGTFAIATQGMQSADPTATIGELWCSYEIEFLKPRFDIDAGIEDDHFRFSTPDPTHPIGTVFPIAHAGNLGIVLSDTSSDGGSFQLEFPVDASDKTFGVQYNYVATTGSVAAAAQLVIHSQTTNVTSIDNNLVSTQNPIIGITKIQATYYFRVGNIANQNQLTAVRLKFNSQIANALPTGAVTKSDIFIYEVNRNVSDIPVL